MDLENSLPQEGVESPQLRQQVEKTLAGLSAVSRQLAHQAQLLETMQQELTAIKEAQVVYGDTVTKMDRQLRRARWWRRIGSLIYWLILLGSIGALAYYFVDWANVLWLLS